VVLNRQENIYLGRRKMAIDFNAVMQKVTELQGKVNDLYGVVGEATVAKFASRYVGEVEFTAGQKQSLETQYQSLIGDIETLVGQLKTPAKL